MCGSDEPHPYPERCSPTILSTSGHARYKWRSCKVPSTTPYEKVIEVPRLPSLVFLFKMIMSMEYLWNKWKRKPRVLGEKRSPVSLYPPHS